MASGDVYRVKLLPSEVTFRGPFVFLYLYRMTQRWLLLNEFRDPLDASDNSFSGVEKLYFEKQGIAGMPEAREYDFWWRLVKPVGTLGSSKYFTYKLNIDWHAIQVKDIEVMHDGKKLNAQNGELTISISGEIVFPKLASNNFFAEFINQTFVERGLRKNIEEHRKVFYKEIYTLQNLLKQYLETHSFLPSQEMFHEKFESQ